MKTSKECTEKAEKALSYSTETALVWANLAVAAAIREADGGGEPDEETEE